VSDYILEEARKKHPSYTFEQQDAIEQKETVGWITKSGIGTVLID